MTTDAATRLALALDDIKVDANGMCRWADIANALDAILRAAASKAQEPGGTQIAAEVANPIGTFCEDHGFKPVYTKRWRTLILVPNGIASEVRDALRALYAGDTKSDGGTEGRAEIACFGRGESGSSPDLEHVGYADLGTANLDLLKPADEQDAIEASIKSGPSDTPPPADAEIRELCRRLRALYILDEVGSDNSLGRDAATALERLSRTDAEEKAGKADEVGWLIEKDDPPVYAVLSDDFDEHWTDSAEKALRFARREDAQAYVDHIGWTSPPVRVVEHMWPAITRPSPASAREEVAQEYAFAHEGHCNASRALPVGCDGCSCRAGHEIKRLNARVAELEKALEGNQTLLQIIYKLNAYGCVDEHDWENGGVGDLLKKRIVENSSVVTRPERKGGAQ